MYYYCVWAHRATRTLHIPNQQHTVYRCSWGWTCRTETCRAVKHIVNKYSTITNIVYLVGLFIILQDDTWFLQYQTAQNCLHHCWPLQHTTMSEGTMTLIMQAVCKFLTVLILGLSTERLLWGRTILHDPDEVLQVRSRLYSLSLIHGRTAECFI